MKLKYQISTVVLLILIIISLVLSLFDLTPQVRKVLTLKQQLTTKQSNFQHLKAKLDSQKSMLETKLEDDLAGAKLLEATPYQLNTNQFLYKIKKLLKKTKVKLNKYLPQKVIKKDSYIKLPIFLELSGDYEALNSFLKELKEIDRLVTIEKIKLIQSDQSLNSNLLIAIYSLVQEEDKNE